MKTKQQYVQELTDLMIDLSDAIKNEDKEKVDEILTECRYIISDIDEADF